ncbi:phospholipase B1, membrane-associated-like [Bradysia coprophila]|uniref:phospholipase B1, membrane-associated-like n=1 Tax=Bradysia coprophila TaxID=38358 RepID=UPI00187D8B7A|nr:phospholipase B1, membrane-associated-like [Bradysia coprophila]XP_037036131.1 phospholipase B1, membrane-associated-like [Bradysia coprophila]XP_037036132.1 phospholipase B1, membrane-associated-like [Bradysia coprophila]
MFKTHFIVIVIITTHCNFVHGQSTYLETFTPLYRLYRYSMFGLIGRSDGESSYDWNLRRGKVQQPFPESKSFFCDTNGPGKRSHSIPQSVHQLRPGDIDIVAAMGDSLTAGNGALATNMLQLFIENKGVSGTIGGQNTWRKYLTLPNMIKEFNPDLYGYSSSDGYSTDKSSRFNVAEMGGMSVDIPHEAEVLVKRMTADPRVKMNEHWKLITILIGPNDFCLNLCQTNNPEKTVELHENDLVKALRVIRDNLPRTMVNLITPPNLKVLTELRGKPSECEMLHHLECPCLFGFRHQSKREQYFKIIERWQKIVSKVADMDEFNRDDFTVNNQPFLKNVTIPMLANGNHDFTYLSLDCFHLSQRGYAIAVNALWNNMMQPEGQKWTNWKKEFTEFICPTFDRPYIATKKNS